MGAARGRPGGAPPAWVWSVRGRALSHPRLPAIWAGCRGPVPTGCGCGGVRAWRPVTNPTARALASWLCALWGRHEGARGGASCLGVGRAGSGALLLPTAQPSGRAAGAHYPLAVGAEGCGRGDPSPTPQRALLRAGFALCGGGTRAPGGAPPAWVWRVRGRALSHPQLPALWAGCRGPLPTGCGCGGVRAWGPVTNPTARALACCGGGMRVPGGGASCLGVGRPGLGALPPPTARPLGGLPGPTTHWLWVRGGAGVGTRHQPNSTRSCVLWGRHEVARGGRLLPVCGASGVGRSPTPDCPPSGRAAGAHYPLAVGAGGCGRGDPSPTTQRALLRAGFARCGGGMRVPGGGASCLGVGRPGSGALPPPTARSLGGPPGPTTHWLWVRGGAGVGPVTNPTARALASWLCTLWGRHEGARGGRLLPECGASGVGRSSTPDCPPSGLAAGAHYPLAVGAGGCGRGDPSPTPLRALLRAGFAHCGGGTRAPGGGASCLGVGRPGSGALPPPTARPLGGLPGPTTHWVSVWGGAGVGTRHQPHSARSCELALRAVGAARGRPGGRLLPGCGACGVGRSPTPDCPTLWAGCRGPLPTGCGCGGVRAWGPVTNPTARALASWLCALWQRHKGARGGASCLGVARAGSGALPPPTARPPGGLPGPTTHWLWVRGGAGVGTRHQPHSARSCVLWGRHEGARGGRLLPGCGASGVGRSPTPDCPPSGRAAGAHYPLAVGAGGCGRGDPSPTQQHALLRAVGAA